MEPLLLVEDLVQMEIRAMNRVIDRLPSGSSSRENFLARLEAYRVVLGFIHERKLKSGISA